MKCMMIMIVCYLMFLVWECYVVFSELESWIFKMVGVVFDVLK